MTKSVLMCLAGRYSKPCNHACSTCYSQDVIMIHVCDQCGKELDDEDYQFDDAPELCPECQSRKEKESYVTV